MIQKKKELWNKGIQANQNLKFFKKIFLKKQEKDFLKKLTVNLKKNSTKNKKIILIIKFVAI